MALDFPSAPTIGQTYPGPNGVTWAWDGAKWTTGATSGPPNGALVAATPPSSPVGTLWYDSTGGNLYVSYNDGNTTQWVPASNIAGLASAATTMDVDKALNDVGRNLIHNSMFNIWQRGTGLFATSGTYSADRWGLFYNSPDTLTVTIGQYNDANRAAIGDDSATNYLAATAVGNAAAAAFSFIAHHVEDARRLAGKTIILSFWASCNTGTPKLGIGIRQWMGTGGSPAGSSDLTGQSVTLVAGTPTRYSVTFTMPGIAGKTLGTNNDSSSRISFWLSSGATNATAAGNPGVQSYTLALWGVQLEIAQPGQTVPTKLEKRDPVLELQQCQRFFETSYVASAPGTVGGNPSLFSISGLTVQANYVSYSVSYAVQKRASPTLTFYSPVTGAAGKIRDYLAGVDVNPTTVINSPVGFTWSATAGSSSGTINMAASWAASADL